MISTLVMSSLLAAKAGATEVPDVVLEYADSFAQSQTVKEQLPPGRTLRDEYANYFFQGFTHR
jgi:hypothetical protein